MSPSLGVSYFTIWDRSTNGCLGKPVADPELFRKYLSTPEVGVSNLLFAIIFVENCMKMKMKKIVIRLGVACGTQFKRNYWPQQSCGKVIFLHMCVCPWGGVSAPLHAGIYTPRGRHPPDADNPNKQTPRKQTPPRGRHPRKQTPPWRQTPPSGSRHPPGSRHNPSQHTVNERPVRILLECILVLWLNDKGRSLHLRIYGVHLKCPPPTQWTKRFRAFLFLDIFAKLYVGTPCRVGTPPQPHPSTSPLGVGLDTPMTRPSTPAWV